jgi:hypothetical protein
MGSESTEETRTAAEVATPSDADGEPVGLADGPMVRTNHNENF